MIINTKKAIQTAATLKVLADPARLRIISLLLEAQEGSCVGDIAEKVHLSPSATSHQLAKLEDKGIVTSSRNGQMMCYKLVDCPVVRDIINVISHFK
tara:strand:- start:1142 stop:1432 length:291 start_codon:yes stop_codon:yes gene_type:complete